MRHFAMTGIVTASWMPWIISGSDIRATPPWTRMSAGTRSSAMTATAPASSAIFACSALTTSMMTPPFSISARPLFTRIVPYSAMRGVYRATLGLEAALRSVQVLRIRRHRPHEDGVPLGLQDVRQVRLVLRRREPLEGVLRVGDVVGALRERDRHLVAVRSRCDEAAVRCNRRDKADLRRRGRDVGEALSAEAGRGALRRVRLRRTDAAARGDEHRDQQKREGAPHPPTVAARSDMLRAWSLGRRSCKGVSMSTSSR